MAICHDGTKICFGTFSIVSNTAGIYIDGKVGSAGCGFTPSPEQGGGTISGYVSGGGPAGKCEIEKFPFTSDTSATDVGQLTQLRFRLTGQSSLVSGYSSGGGEPELDTIDKFPFAADGASSDVGELSVARQFVAGQSSSD